MTTSALFRLAPFRRYFYAMCLSTMGTWVNRFLLGWSAWELTHSAMWVGITSAGMLLPTFLFSPIFGVLSDRIDLRNGLLTTLTSQALVAALATLALSYDWFNLYWLLSLVVLTGVIGAAHSPIRLAMVPRLVNRELLPNAIGISAIIFNLARILGPSLAGWLIHKVSPAVAFGIGTALYAASVIAMATVHGIRAEGEPSKNSMWSDLGAGFRFSMTTPVIRLILCMTLLNGLLGRTIIELLPAFSGKLLDGTAATLAFLTACAGGGSIFGGLILTRYRSDEHALVRLVVFSLLSAALCVLPVYWTTALYPVAGIIFYLSLATTMAGIGSQALLQLIVADEYRGRVMSFWTVFSMGAPAVGSFAMGALADQFGFVATILGFACAAIVADILLSRAIRPASFHSPEQENAPT